MSISIFYILDASFISAEKARWSLLSVRSSGKVKYIPFTEEITRSKNDVRRSDRLLNNNDLQSVKLN